MAGFDKIGKDTGPGKATTELTTRPSVVCTHILYNYNIDGNVLKPEHKEFLDRDVAPFLREHRVHAKLTGTASQSGDREYNRQLSLGRVLRVKEYLGRQGIPESKLPGPDIQAAGEDLSTSKSTEDELDRAVRITIALGIKSLPLWPTIVIPILITAEGSPPIDFPPVVITGSIGGSEPWTIRQIYGHNVGVSYGANIPLIGFGVGTGLVEYHFLLVNRETQQMAQCRFFGPAGSAGVGPAGATFGVGPSAGMSMTMQSKNWNNFSTKKGVGFSDFDGQATWHEPGSVGLGTDISVPSTLELRNLGISVSVQTGRTIGFPGSALSSGSFRCKPPVQLKL